MLRHVALRLSHCAPLLLFCLTCSFSGRLSAQSPDSDSPMAYQFSDSLAYQTIVRASIDDASTQEAPIADAQAAVELKVDPLPAPAKSQGPQPLVLLQSDRLKITGHFQAGINAVSEVDVFWNLAATTAPGVDFDADPEWLEAYFKPGISFQRTGDFGFSSYGKLSAVSSGTLEIDAFDRGNTGRTTFEEGYLGLQREANFLVDSWDVSFGPRELVLGTGMLIANGGQNGFERGALKFGPRKAWEFAAIGRLKRERMTTTLFYLDANEMRSNDTGTTLSGIDLRMDDADQHYAGTTFVYVPTSDSPYPQAAPVGLGPPTILPGAREGLTAVNPYVKITPLQQYPDIFVTADFAYESNDRIDLRAWGGRIQAGKTLKHLPGNPRFTYSYQTFSGDDPATTRLERFDPLAFQGSPTSWATGSKSAMVFINSNVNAHQLTLAFNPTVQDTITFRYAYLRANELFSPLQFGQATRLELENGNSTVVTGVADAHLADDFFIEYNRIVNPYTFFNAGFSVSLPGRGIELVAPGTTSVWPGGFANIVINY